MNSIFLSGKKNGSFRLVIDLKKINNFIPYNYFKTEDLLNVKELLVIGDWIVKLDLKDACFTVLLSKTDRK